MATSLATMTFGLAAGLITMIAVPPSVSTTTSTILDKEKKNGVTLAVGVGKTRPDSRDLADEFACSPIGTG